MIDDDTGAGDAAVRARTRESDQPWRAVVVVAPESACRAARALGDRCFLASAAPALPLPDCDLPDDCDCTFRHQVDRRRRQRRIGGEDGAEHSPERRRGVGRRSTD